ncbi:MAG: hypothetical protein HUN04_06160 [Desulfobacter sp.]|nr:MAG: hypothetical protein HUN04_06160 [Desulfobacter sp.]
MFTGAEGNDPAGILWGKIQNAAIAEDSKTILALSQSYTVKPESINSILNTMVVPVDVDDKTVGAHGVSKEANPDFQTGKNNESSEHIYWQGFWSENRRIVRLSFTQKEFNCEALF